MKLTMLGAGEMLVVKALACKHEDTSFPCPEPTEVLGGHDNLPAVPASETGRLGIPRASWLV